MKKAALILFAFMVAMLIVTTMGCTKQKTTKCYQCTITNVQTAAGGVGNEPRGVKQVEIVEVCMGSPEELYQWKQSKYKMEVRKDSIFQTTVTCK